MKVIPFVPNAPFLYPYKTENLAVFWYFQGVEKGSIGNNGLVAAWKMSEYEAFSGLDTAKQGPEKTSYSDIF